MNPWTPRQAIELFHLLFLDQLGRKLDKNFYALKGGVNLRFFFKSIRYSEDIDLDIQTVSPETLQKNINKILTSKGFASILRTKNIQIESVSASKQTETTQRWKLTLKVSKSTFPLHTKIEFSRRGLSPQTLFEPVDAELMQHYQLYPILINHYGIQTAFQQKLEALLGRTESQARDLFDLYHLLQWGGEIPSLPTSIKNRLKEATSKILSISFDDFKGQVAAYLLPHYQKQYESGSQWKKIVLTLLQSLGKKNEDD